MMIYKQKRKKEAGQQDCQVLNWSSNTKKEKEERYWCLGIAVTMLEKVLNEDVNNTDTSGNWKQSEQV
jgi:hypothetical protein